MVELSVTDSQTSFSSPSSMILCLQDSKQIKIRVTQQQPREQREMAKNVENLETPFEFLNDNCMN